MLGSDETATEEIENDDILFSHRRHRSSSIGRTFHQLQQRKQQRRQYRELYNYTDKARAAAVTLGFRDIKTQMTQQRSKFAGITGVSNEVNFSISYTQGLHNMRQGDPQLALKFFTRFQSVVVGKWGAHFNEARSRLREKLQKVNGKRIEENYNKLLGNNEQWRNRDPSYPHGITAPPQLSVFRKINKQKALGVNPDSSACLVARSKCYLQLGEVKKALEDAELALQKEPKSYKAIYQKAEALYTQGDFEHALVYFCRGAAARKEKECFRLGIQKSREAISKAIG